MEEFLQYEELPGHADPEHRRLQEIMEKERGSRSKLGLKVKGVDQDAGSAVQEENDCIVQ